jgi:hypothetical protein
LTGPAWPLAFGGGPRHGKLDVAEVANMSPRPLLIVSFYTEGTPYEQEAGALAASIRGVGGWHVEQADGPLVFDIRGLPNQGSWSANARYKPRFLLEMLIGYGETHRLLWLDADARLRRRPVLLERLTDGDVAAHWLAFKGHPPELLSSAIWINPSHRTRRMLEQWAERNEARPDRRRADQENLQDVIEDLERRGELDVIRLGPAYAFITDLSRQAYPGVSEVIEQTQASRRLKAVVNGR